MNNEILEMPKVELHLHLDGSVPFSVLERLSGLSYNEVYKRVVSENDYKLANYLKRFDFVNSLIKTKEDLELISYSLGKELEKENVIYAEIRFAPIDYINDCLTGDDIIESVLLGLSKCSVKTNLILCMRRGSSLSYNKKVIELANKYLNKGVVAVDLVGDEENYPFEKYRELFDICKYASIPVTIHAGEVTKRDIKDIIPYTKRIGHGIKIYDDLELINLVKDNNILLEVCPNSNLDTRNIVDYYHHPIKKLYDYGVKLSVSTDNRIVSNITLTEEYTNLIKYLDFTISDLYQMNLNAIDFAFISETEKQKLKDLIKNKNLI